MCSKLQDLAQQVKSELVVGSLWSPSRIHLVSSRARLVIKQRCDGDRHPCVV